MMRSMTPSHGDPSKPSTRPTTAIPSTVFEEIVRTNSSPADIAARLNEAELRYSCGLKSLHKNAKRVYPFWKTCRGCSTPFPCHNRTQAVRNTVCPPCGREGLRAPRPQTQKPRPICETCHEPFTPKGGVALAKAKHCSRKCFGAQHWTKTPEGKAKLLVWGALGAAGWTDASMASFKVKMTGPNNPAWKGGVMVFKTHGNYAGVRYVRCPPEFLSMARKDGYVMEHRLIVARVLGRCLSRTETVHHVNHIPTDNRLENLALFKTNREHKLYEHHGSPPPIWCGSSPSPTTASCGA